MTEEQCPPTAAGCFSRVILDCLPPPATSFLYSKCLPWTLATGPIHGCLPMTKCCRAFGTVRQHSGVLFIIKDNCSSIMGC